MNLHFSPTRSKLDGATRVKTPHLDRLALEGVRFTDAHATSSTCTPSRCLTLTGVLPGGAPLIIEPGRTTTATVLQRTGCQTGVVGRWHPGLAENNNLAAAQPDTVEEVQIWLAAKKGAKEE